MTIDKRISRRVPEFSKFEEVSGTRITSGPFIGKIKNNLDPTHTGRLQIWIPEFGGDEDDTENWRTVSYASPFLGSTAREDDEKNNNFSGVPHTYGMWFTVPDLENLVLCTFIAGDPRRGFWFACIPKYMSQYMLPAMGASDKYEAGTLEDEKLKKIKKHSKLPVVEFNENRPSVDLSKFKDIAKPIHEEQLKILVEQGLDRDDTRGIITSSSQRESPSNVFGFSTPGRPVKNPAEEIVKNNPKEVSPRELAIKSRRGGHSLVLDDGDGKNKNQLVRLRTATGHQIIMNDTDSVLYIINNKGTAWVELAADGKINVFSESSINLRSKGDFNLHADKDININAEGNFNLRAKSNINFESESYTLNTSKKIKLYSTEGTEIGSKNTINLHATGAGSFVAGGNLIFEGSKILLNSGPGTKVSAPDPLVKYKHSDTTKDGNGQWQEQADKIESIAKLITAHEPFTRKEGTTNAAACGANSAAAAASASSATTAPTATAESTATTPTTTPTPTTTTAPATTSSTASTTTTTADTTQNVQVAGNGTQVSTSGRPVIAENPATPSDAGLRQALLAGVTKPADKSLMLRSDNPTPSRGIGPLSQTELKALFTQLGHNESSFKYDTKSPSGSFLGKYQIGAAALTDQGYIKPDAYAKYGAASIKYPSSWTGKDNVKTESDFLSNPQAQENAMYSVTLTNYQRLIRSGGIKSDDDRATVSGMLATAHLLGAGGYDKAGKPIGALGWRLTGQGEDQNKTTGTQYFNAGRYAHAVLSKVD